MVGIAMKPLDHYHFLIAPHGGFGGGELTGGSIVAHGSTM